MNLDECRQVTRRVLMGYLTSVDKCRRVQANQNGFFDSIMIHGPICCCNYATAGRIGMYIFNFIVSSVIIAHQSVLTPRISKTHLPISSLNLHELELK